MLENSFWLTRFYFQRALGGIYTTAFLIAIFQFRALCGSRGLLPIGLFLKRARFWDAPSLFWLNHSDSFIMSLACLGLGLSVLALSGLSDRYGTFVSVCTWLFLWVIYSSFVNVGQSFYGFGWEIMLLETGFLAIFMGASSTPPSWIMMVLLQWLLFRLMFGAGLIKIRGDECWRDLTCMKYHYETMPMPGPLSRYFHFLPMWVHKGEVLMNHFVELFLPFFYFGPRVLRTSAGLATILFQFVLILSGNFSWLNYIAIVVAIGCLDDSILNYLLNGLNSWPRAMGVSSLVQGNSPDFDMAMHASAGIPVAVVGLLAVGVAILSIAPIQNLITSGQVMNTSFEPFHLVNTYGAFGSITRERNEIILEGADDRNGPWKEYEFKGKPGDPAKAPPLVSPYHYKLDWQMWFAAMSSYHYHPWILNLIAKLLQGNKDVLSLIRPSPFLQQPPKFIKASKYRYHYAEPGSQATWRREYIGEYLPPLSLQDRQFTDVLRNQGWL
jgi:hypothetical protein